ncbi:MAG TPA: efflux RND transporter permease subunit [Gemmatimonadaceae bacterium]
MLGAIVRFSVRHSGIIVALAVAVMIYGLNVVAHTTYDVFPEFAAPQVAVQTEASGFTPEQVEVLVTKPLENAINGTNGIAAVRSQSIEGLSVITAVFAEGTDVFRARQAIAERLGEAAHALPAAAGTPTLTPLTSSTGVALVIGLTSSTRSTRDERTFADWTLRPRLLAVPGVARVTIYGGEVRQLQVQLDPARLRSLGLSVGAVAQAASQATGVRGAGGLRTANQTIQIRTEGQMPSVDLLAQSVVRESNGAVIRLADVGRVVEGAAPLIGGAAVEGQPAVVLNIDAQYGANLRDVSTAVESALAQLAPTIAAEGYILHPALFRPATFIDVALRNVEHSLLIGGALVAVVLVLFLADLGAAAVSLTAIPLSLLAAIIVLHQFGLTVNTLTLGGLAIAIGEVVDDAIIDVENIARRLRENRALQTPRPVVDVVYDASLEVRSSVVFATFVVVLVFVPVVTLSGVQGAFFRPLALAYMTSILASLVVALTVTPALTLLLIARRTQHAGEPRALAWIKRGYARRLQGFEQHPVAVMVGTGVLILVAIAMIPLFGGGFLPEFNEGHFILHMTAVPGTSVEQSLRIGHAVTAALRKDPRIQSVAQRVGRAELAEESAGTHESEFELDLIPLSGDAAETARHDIRQTLATIPGVNFQVTPFLSERIDETLSGSTAPIVVKVFGEDLDSIDVATRAVSSIVGKMPGATDVRSGTPAVAPEVVVTLRPEALAHLGVAAEDALVAVETATRGAQVSQVFENGRATNVVVMLAPEQLGRAEDLVHIPLATTSGRVVELGQVAEIARVSSRYGIAHEGARRLQIVSAGVAGGNVASFTQTLERQLATLRLPRSVYAEVGGSGTAERTARHELLLRSLLAALGIVMLLWLAFGDSRRLLLVLANLPFALVGGVLAVFAGGGLVSLGSLVGFVTLFGISTRNAIMLISHYDHLVRAEGAQWGPETALRGATERLGPILMTALVTGLGLLPLALGTGDPGREIEGPLAIVILGGLVTSTVLSLFVLPTLALRFGRFGGA